MKKILPVLCLLFIGITNVLATHNKAGEITYTHISGMKYGITVNTYTNTYNTNADRCEVTVIFWVGQTLIDSIVIPRVNGSTGVLTNCPTHDGEMLNTMLGTSLYPNTKYNRYYGEFTFPGPTTYRMTMDDPNRNAGTCNINNGNSVNTSFSLVSELVINPFLGYNDSPVLYNLPLDQACVGVCFKHNPGAYDPNGDSLAYSLIPCADVNGIAIPGWVFPPNMSGNDIDARKGDLVWCAPNQVCNYNIAILIKQYRRLSGSPTRYYIGSVVRDMQIEVQSCANNPPVIAQVDDTCIVANTLLHFIVSATDAEFNTVTLEGNGGPFHITPTATFSSTPSFSPVSGAFNWTPNCSQVQLLPYLVTFKATDSGTPTNTPLVDYKSIFIRVIAPAPTGLTATPSGASIIVDWNAAACHDSVGVNPLTGYHIYRKNSCDPFIHSTCETGLPATSGYTLIGNTGPNTTIFTDNNNGQGLISGITYSYIVVAYYSDGSQSYASTNVCATLVRDVPIITNVSVMTTDAANGSMWIHWVKPLAGLPNLDTIANPPPYKYKLMRARGLSGSLNFTAVPSAVYTFNSFYQLNDTGFVDTGLNTMDFGYTYRVDFYYSDTVLRGSTNTASSVFLTSTPAGNQVNLTWQAIVPWVNYRYVVYKKNALNVYDSIAGTTLPNYTDTGLVNGHTYCYKIRSVGEYTDSALPRPLYNLSQEHCEKPVDVVPPCQPSFMVENDCGIFQNVLSWTNPNTYCSHDAVGYNIYFAPTTNDSLQLLTIISDVNTTSYTHIYLYEGIPSTAGCYAVTAFDTVGNESPIITKTCVDNCPEYELPNVFTPNGDGVNDWVLPLPGYRYVKDVEMKIYDRWGLLMFETNDKDILWDGRNSSTKMICPNGVYFYVCTVNEIRVDGITPRVLKGFIQLLKEQTNPSR